jgi:acetyl esterase/lipase
MVLSWSFFFFSLSWLYGALNALFPVRNYRLFVIPSWIFGWLVGEAPLHWLVGELAITALFLSEGPFRKPIGWVGLAIALLAWSILLFLHRKGEDAARVFEQVLHGSLSDSYRERVREGCELNAMLPRSRLWAPWWYSHSGVRRVRNLAYGTGHRRQKLDIYLPRADVKNAPVLLQIHGGFWSFGNKNQQGQPLLYYMAARGWVCVSINYSLSPWRRWPAQLLDAKRALIWVKQHIAEHGGDPNFVVCTGGSAGGHITSLMALTANQPALQPDAPDVDTSVQAAVPFYGLYDLCNSEQQHRHGGLRMLLEWIVMGKSYKKAELLFREASPVTHIHEGAPPFLIVHGSHDSLACVEEARLFDRRLRAVSKAPVLYAELPYAQHAFEIFHSRRTTHVVRATHHFCEVVYAQHLQARAGVELGRAHFAE